MSKRSKASDDFELPPETEEERRERVRKAKREATLAAVAEGRKPPLPKGTLAKAFEQVGFDEIIGWIEAGDGLHATCQRVFELTGVLVDIGSLHRWITADDQRSARYRLARLNSAQSYDQKAETVLLQAPSDKVEIMRARELAQHYRWMAKTRNPREFGDKLEVESKNTTTHNIAEVDSQLASLFEKFISGAK